MEKGKDVDAAITVLLLLVVSMTYARFASSSIRPGKLRLLSLLPVLALLPYFPWYFSSIILRGGSAFLLVWLSTFKILLLAFGLGPLSSPRLPISTFVAISLLPLELRRVKSSSPEYVSLLFPYAIKLSLLSILISQYQHKNQLHSYLQPAFFGLFIYLVLDLSLASFAYLARALLGLELEPQFDAPFKSVSLQDFWGRRWNLMVTSILRPSVYLPVRQRWGTTAGVLATFTISAFMHEILIYYYTLARPTGELSCFFLLHGICTALEVKAMKSGWWRPNHVVAVLSTLGFVIVTSFLLFLPSMLRSGADVETLQECAAIMRFVEDGGRAVISRLVSII